MKNKRIRKFKGTTLKADLKKMKCHRSNLIQSLLIHTRSSYTLKIVYGTFDFNGFLLWIKELTFYTLRLKQSHRRIYSFKKFSIFLKFRYCTKKIITVTERYWRLSINSLILFQCRVSTNIPFQKVTEIR